MLEIYSPANKQLQSKFVLRVGSSDRKSVDETWIKKVYQRPTLPFIVEPNERWLDLGANIGAFTCYAALKGATVKAYEPQLDNAELIKQNCHLNGVKDRVEIFNDAIVPDTEHGKTLNFYESTNPTSFRRHTLYGNYLNSAKKKKVVVTKVNAVGFSNVIKSGCDCVKMNIEGAEIPIIMELTNNLGIKKLVFEYSFDMDNKISTYKNVIAKLETLFEIVKPARTIPLHLETYPYYPPNCYIFCVNK